jgi:thymidine phosphorylase
MRTSREDSSAGRRANSLGLLVHQSGTTGGDLDAVPHMPGFSFCAVHSQQMQLQQSRCSAWSRAESLVTIDDGHMIGTQWR